MYYGININITENWCNEIIYIIIRQGSTSSVSVEITEWVRWWGSEWGREGGGKWVSEGEVRKRGSEERREGMSEWASEGGGRGKWVSERGSEGVREWVS